MGKGSKRRPSRIDYEELSRRWGKAFNVTETQFGDFLSIKTDLFEKEFGLNCKEAVKEEVRDVRKTN